MKIIHIITKLHEMYGAQRHAIESIKNHLKNNHQCLVISGTDGYASDEIKSMGVQVITIPTIKNSYNLLIDIKAITDIVATIKSYSPDIVISHSSKAGVLARIACYQTKTPNIFTVQGWPFENGTPLMQKIIALAIERLLVPYSDAYMCVSNYTKKFGLSKLPLNTSNIYVCPNMHEDRVFLHENEIKLSYNVLMVAGFRGQKDHITALKALKIIVSENKLPKIHFTFAGDGPRRTIIEQFISDNNLGNYITLAGETKDIDFFYNNADIVILPTFYEGLPLSLLEAIQRGKPVIATDTGGVNEIVVDNENGKLIEVGDATTLAKHITDYYLNNKIPQLSQNSKRIYSSRYSYDIISKKLNTVIEAALKNSVFNHGHTKHIPVALETHGT